MSAGLEASTVTPGSTAPDVSLTTPAIPLADACCADATPRQQQRTDDDAHAQTSVGSYHWLLLLPCPLAFRVADACDV